MASDANQAGATPNRDELMEQGERLVYSLAARIHRNLPLQVDREDLVAYGMIGLAEAARDFDPSQQTQFTTFAYYRVRGAIYDGVSQMSWTSRARFNRMRYEQRANALLAEQEAGAHSNATLEENARWLARMSEQLAVIFFGSQDEESGLRDSTVEDTSSRTAAMIAAQREIVARLRDLVDKLPAAERGLIRGVYFEGLPLQEAAKRVGISKSWASRLHARTLEQLANALQRTGAE